MLFDVIIPFLLTGPRLMVFTDLRVLPSEAMKAFSETQQAVEPNPFDKFLAHSPKWPWFSFPVSVIFCSVYGMRGLASCPTPNMGGLSGCPFLSHKNPVSCRRRILAFRRCRLRRGRATCDLVAEPITRWHSSALIGCNWCPQYNFKEARLIEQLLNRIAQQFG